MLCKVVLVGDSHVGKSCLLLRFTEGRFFPCPAITIGMEFATVSLPRVRLQIWDTSGLEVFRAITRGIYRGARMILIVYDVTDRRTFLNLPGWVHDCDPETPRILVGNKCDRGGERQVTTQEARAFAVSHGMCSYYETSAYTNENVDLLFMRAARIKPPPPGPRRCC